MKWTHTNRELILDSDEAYVKAFRYIFTEARCCLCSALPIGSHYEYESQDRYQAAELLYQQALQLSKRLLREEHPLVATSLNNLAFLYQSQGKYQEREITTLNNLGCAYSDLGDYPRAIDHHQQSFNIAKDIDDLNVRCINSLIMPTVCRQLSYFLGGLSTIIVRLLIGQSIIFGCLEPLPFKHFSSLAFFDSS
ncbi:tetratricopeptide repeat protein [Moorena producens]|uniref:tetratricopeptide repeat protein n=1 Tax=Moorena producens TaxID=1155739 RepID=UPI003C734619